MMLPMCVGPYTGNSGVSRAAYPTRLCSITSVKAVEATRMDRSSVSENEAERARLKAVVARLTDADLARAMSEEWTVGVGR
jgi:hypothetical protein